MWKVRLSGPSSFFLTNAILADTLEGRRQLADLGATESVSKRSRFVFRQNTTKVSSVAGGSYLAVWVVCAVSCFLAGSSWAAPNAISGQIADELDRHLVASEISKERHVHVLVDNGPLFVSNVDDSIPQTPVPQVPAGLLAEPEDSKKDFQPIPEPSSLALMGGLGGLLFFIHRLRAYFDRSTVR